MAEFYDICTKLGQQVRKVFLKFPVTVSWYYIKRDKGRLEKRFVLSTRCGTRQLFKKLPTTRSGP